MVITKHATKAISLFLKQPRRSLLVLKADDQAEYADLLAELIRQEQPKERSAFGVNYVVEQEILFLSLAFIYRACSISADNFAAQGDVLKALHADQFTLLVVCCSSKFTRYFAYTRFSASSQWWCVDFKRSNNAEPI